MCKAVEEIAALHEVVHVYDFKAIIPNTESFTSIIELR